MKKLLVFLFSIVMLSTLTACGSDNKEESNKPNESSQKEEEKKQEENNNQVVIDDEIIEFDDEDNQPIDNTPVSVKEVINCPGCVYAYFDAEGDAAKKIGSTVSSSEYTTDINNLNKGRKQRNNCKSNQREIKRESARI